MPVGLGPMELIIILCIIIVLFGASRLSEVGGALGKGIRDFRKAASENVDAEPSPTLRS